MLNVYPAIFHKESEEYWVEFPDLEGCNSCGFSLAEAIELAQEALGLYLVSIIEDGHSLPEASRIEDVKKPSNGIVNYVATDMDKYRKNTKAVKKTLSIPAWLAEEAEKKNLSLSKVLQDGLKEKLV
jgi:Uncharacterized conserved protein